MKALVLAGGSGVRMRPFTHSMAKQLIPVAGQPVLEHVLASVAALGTPEVGVVVGDWAEQIAAAIGDGTRFEVNITYLRQDRPGGLAHAVALARDFLGDEDFVLYLGDNLFKAGVSQAAAQFMASRPAAHLVVQAVADPRSYGVAEVTSTGLVTGIAEKPSAPRSDLAVTGVYFFTPVIHDAIAGLEPSERGELEITDAVQRLISQGATVTASSYRGFWRDAGQVGDLLDCNRELLRDQRAVVAPDVTMVRSRIEGPAIVGSGTALEACVIGPSTTIGRDCLLRSVNLTDCIVLDGTTIDAAADGAAAASLELRGQLIGRAGRVSRDGHLVLPARQSRGCVPFPAMRG